MPVQVVERRHFNPTTPDVAVATAAGAGSGVAGPAVVQLGAAAAAAAGSGVAGDASVTSTVAYTVFGSAVAPYPDRSETQSQSFDSHEADLGTMGCLRSYSQPGDTWPTTWSGLSGPHPRFGDWQHRWSWHSLKPDPQSIAAGTEYANIRDFIASIPVTGYKRLITVWHESDVGSKIPGTMSYSECKQMLYESGRAIRDEAHPDVLYGPVFGSGFTTGKADTIMAATWTGQTTATSTALLRGVVDFVGWDPYNLASQNGDYSAGKQGSTGTAFYLDPCLAWNVSNFPAARHAIGEFGYRANQSDLSMRPAYLQAMVDYCAANDIFVCCYFDLVATTEKENWIRIYSTPRSATTYAGDSASIAKWAAVYAAHPPYVS